jgi:hypothetical protein
LRHKQALVQRPVRVIRAGERADARERARIHRHVCARAAVPEARARRRARRALAPFGTAAVPLTREVAESVVYVVGTYIGDIQNVMINVRLSQRFSTGGAGGEFTRANVLSAVGDIRKREERYMRDAVSRQEKNHYRLIATELLDQLATDAADACAHPRPNSHDLYALHAHLKGINALLFDVADVTAVLDALVAERIVAIASVDRNHHRVSFCRPVQRAAWASMNPRTRALLA